MKKNLLQKIGALSIAASMLFGCSTHQEVVAAKEQMGEKINALASTFPKAEQSANKQLIVFKDGAYFGNKMVAVANERFLPPVFSQTVKFADEQPLVNLPEFAELITRKTGIPVDINQNIYLKSAALPTTTRPATANGPAAAPQQNAGQDVIGNNAFEQERNISLDFKGPFAKFLDITVAKLGISWEYDNGRLQFFRYKSKSFEIKGPIGTYTQTTEFRTAGDITAANGQSGSSSAGVGTKINRTSEYNYFQSLAAQVQARVTAGGKVVPNDGGHTLVVTDTPASLKEISAFIEDANRRASRGAFFTVGLYRMSDGVNDQGGVNWAGILSSTKYRLITAPGASVTTDTGGLGIFRLAPSANNPTLGTPGTTGDAFNGSQGSSLLFQALRSLNGVSEEWIDDGYTINHMPLPFTNSTTREYVAETGVVSTQVSTQTSVKQKEYSFGVNIELTPHIYDNNTMMLEMVIDVTDEAPFDITPVAGGTIVRSKTVPRRASRQVIMVQPGETIVLTKIGRNQHSGNSNLGLTGVSDNVRKVKDNMLLVITPVLYRAPT